jgi:transcriptional regulator with GAF, ATPase, and Fis domain
MGSCVWRFLEKGFKLTEHRPLSEVSSGPKTLKNLMREHERLIVVKTMERNGGNQQLSANALGITKRALQKILERQRLVKRRFTKPLPISSNLITTPEETSQDRKRKS